ncbi:hypothetical protein Harman_09050 [Haloarcula mannanilytica]|uniref:Uncharacterized protein n=1 Tax=Haloarcula mannanilytica TaxID=2509225 RepID=A0A4C2EI58_9EURY|nr:hypothetical protein Harman_09050 [Haloarcula mannanilytica]
MTLGLLIGAGGIVLEVATVTVPNALEIIGVSVAVVLSLWMALEGAMAQRHGLGTLDRGGPVQRTARYLLVAVTTLAGLVVTVRFLTLALPWAVETGNTPAQILGGLLAVALVATLYRTLTAVRDGYRHSGDRR